MQERQALAAAVALGSVLIGEGPVSVRQPFAPHVVQPRQARGARAVAEAGTVLHPALGASRRFLSPLVAGRRALRRGRVPLRVLQVCEAVRSGEHEALLDRLVRAQVLKVRACESRFRADSSPPFLLRG